MRLLPDTETTATGYLWLDRLTAPLWNWYADRQERKLFRDIGGGSESKGRAMLRRAAEDYFDYDDEAML